MSARWWKRGLLRGLSHLTARARVSRTPRDSDRHKDELTGSGHKETELCCQMEVLIGLCLLCIDGKCSSVLSAYHIEVAHRGSQQQLLLPLQLFRLLLRVVLPLPARSCISAICGLITGRDSPVNGLDHREKMQAINMRWSRIGNEFFFALFTFCELFSPPLISQN